MRLKRLILPLFVAVGASLMFASPAYADDSVLKTEVESTNAGPHDVSVKFRVTNLSNENVTVIVRLVNHTGQERTIRPADTLGENFIFETVDLPCNPDSRRTSRVLFKYWTESGRNAQTTREVRVQKCQPADKTGDEARENNVGSAGGTGGEGCSVFLASFMVAPFVLLWRWWVRRRIAA